MLRPEAGLAAMLGPQAPKEIIVHLNGAEIFDAPSERGTLCQSALNFGSGANLVHQAVNPE